MNSHGNSVYAEQPGSLARQLAHAGVLHGDTADVELVGVGVNDMKVTTDVTTLAFCPITRVVVDRRSIRHGTPRERAKPIPHKVGFSTGARRIMRNLQGRHGFARVQCTVHSNGRIHLSNFRILNFTPSKGRVSGTNSFREFQEAATD